MPHHLHNRAWAFLFHQVFFSGCLHGDEQVGPTAVLETAKLMVYAAVCQADATSKVQNTPTMNILAAETVRVSRSPVSRAIYIRSMYV